MMLSHAQLPPDKALVPFVNVENMLAQIHTCGIDTCLRDSTRRSHDFRHPSDNHVCAL